MLGWINLCETCVLLLYMINERLVVGISQPSFPPSGRRSTGTWSRCQSRMLFPSWWACMLGRRLLRTCSWVVGLRIYNSLFFLRLGVVSPGPHAHSGSSDRQVSRRRIVPKNSGHNARTSGHASWRTTFAGLRQRLK